LHTYLEFARRLDRPGYLVLDDLIVEKAFATRLPWAGWTYSFAKKRKVYGLHIVLRLSTSADRQWRIPVGFRLWRPQRSCARQRYQTKLQLAAPLLESVVAARLPVEYVVCDTAYTAGWFTKKLSRLGLSWQGTLHPDTTVYWRNLRLPVWLLAGFAETRWRMRLGVRAVRVRVGAPTYGARTLVVTRNRHGNEEFLVTKSRTADVTTIVERKRSRWSVETVFRDGKQYAGLDGCQCWSDVAWVRHVGLVLLTFVVLQVLRERPSEPLAAVKERWQLAVIRSGDQDRPHMPAPAVAAHRVSSLNDGNTVELHHHL
jgi:SRSO17 transposase